MLGNNLKQSPQLSEVLVQVRVVSFIYYFMLNSDYTYNMIIL